ncbi:MAG TPA: HAD family hydrolase, partial [Actinobacteria bacterium]|nr:HAD family hydrolase [Actinomycetota bacterium]
LVRYTTREWERRAYHHAKLQVADRGWPVDDLEFDPTLVIQGLTIDLELGNLLKVTRFGYVIRAQHGTRPLEHRQMRKTYSSAEVDLAEDRWLFLNTMFSMSEAILFAQVVDLADQGAIPEVVGYEDLYWIVRSALDAAHLEGTLKAEILADPDRFIEPDPAVVTTLRDQRAAGKKLLLITNSEWEYASQIMQITFDPHMGDGETWRDLFDVVIVSAAKPGFFLGKNRLHEIVDLDRALLRPHFEGIKPGGVYFGGNAHDVEQSLGLSGDQILYVGDHLFGDVLVSKATLRWRTALIIHELEDEVSALEKFAPREKKLAALMVRKEELEARQADLRLTQLRARSNKKTDVSDLEADLTGLRDEISTLDTQIAPLAIESGNLVNKHWGPLMRAGADKSLFARQVERHADVYTSRVSNFGAVTPFAYLRAFRSPLPHEDD